ncbi:MAG: PAS domain S-box protein [Planctomycetota bacterium]|jgi:PAS domain S-box-containing protein|nr:PAS domain S-box protein [Planctomycetota bacterium]
MFRKLSLFFLIDRVALFVAAAALAAFALGLLLEPADPLQTVPPWGLKIFGGILLAVVLWLARLLYVFAKYRNLLELSEQFDAQATLWRQQWQQLLNSAPLAVSLWTPDGKMLDCNDEAVRMLGCESKHAYINGFYDRLNPAVQPDGTPTPAAAERYLKSALASGYERFFWEYRTVDGAPLPVETTLLRLAWQDRYFIAAYSRDLRESISLQRQAREAEQQLRQIFNASPVLTVLWSEDGQIIDANDEVVRVIGCASKEEYLRRVYDYCPPEQGGRPTAEAVAAIINQARADGSVRSRFELRDVAGKPVPLDIVAVRLNWNDGYRVVAFARDLREEIAGRQAVEDAYANAAAMMEKSPLTCVLWEESPDGWQTVDCNAATATMFGYASRRDFCDNFVARPHARQPGGDDGWKQGQKILAATMDQGHQYFSQYNFLTKNGEPLPAEMTLARVRYRNRFRIAMYLRDRREEIKKQRELDAAYNNSLTMLKAMPLGAVVWDDQMRVVDCNPQMLDWFGYKSVEELRANFWDKSINHADAEALDGARNAFGLRLAAEHDFALTRQNFQNFETGEIVPAELSISRLPYRESYRLVVYVRDLRHDIQHQREMAEAYANVMLMFGKMPLTCILWQKIDGVWTVCDCNQAAVDAFGYDSTADFCADFNRLSNTSRAEEDNRAEKVLDAALASGGNHYFKNYFAKNGDVLPGEVTLVRIPYGDDFRVASYIRDRRDEIRQHHEVQTAYATIRTIVEKMPIGCSIYDRDARMVFYNRTSAEICGYALVTANQADSLNILASTTYQTENQYRHLALLDAIKIAVRDGYHEQVTVSPNLATGEDVSIFHTLVRLPFLDDYRVVVYGRDLRDEIAREKRLREEKERILAQSALIKAEAAAARESSEAKSLFFANMSHEIRTPINAVIGMTDIARSASPSETQECLFRIADASQHLLSMINDILDFSKIEAGRLRLENEEFDFSKAIFRALNLIAVRATEKDIKLRARLDNNVPQTVVGDETRLVQVLMNLLSNAMKFTPEKGTVRVLVTLASGEASGKTRLHVRVADTGIGIRDEQIGKIFLAFEQADASTSRKYGGTGLGLAISRKIVQLMGGEMSVQSVVGKGSTFSLTVALTAAAAPVKMLLPACAPKNLHILVSAPASDDFAAAVATLPGKSVAASSLSEASEAARSALAGGKPFDLLVLDYDFTGDDAFTLLVKIREAFDEMLLPAVIFATAGQADKIEKRARELRFTLLTPCLPKPLTPEKLRAALEELTGAMLAQTTEALVVPDYHGKKILVAEDIKVNRQVIRHYFAATNAELLFAENGAEAVQAFAAQRDELALILMDVQMPEMDGYEATRRIRALEAERAAAGEKFSPVTIFAMTANVFREDVDKALAAGMDGHLGKPVDRKKMYAALNKYLSANEAPPAEKTATEKTEPAQAVDAILPTTPAPSAAPALYGINVAAALERFALREIYVEMIREFPPDPTYAQMTEAVRNGDRVTAQRFAHSLKGVAANMAFDPLYALITDVEKDLKTVFVPPSDPRWAAIDATYRATVATIEKIVAQPELLPEAGS